MALKLISAGLWAMTVLGNPITAELPKPDFKGPMTTLKPAVHWDHDKYDLSHLIPSQTSSLYWSSSGVSHPAIPHQFGYMHSTFSKASVVLEHSAYIGKISCTRGGMVIPFTEETAYTTAKTHWPSSGGFVIVSHTAQCGQDKSGQRTHWTIQKAEAHDRDQTITVLATEIELEQALHGAHLQYGMYQPQKEFPSGGDKSKLRRQVSSPMGTCGTPPASTPSGIPATYCGAGFDQRLDSELGFLSFATPEEFSASLRIIAPHLDDYTQSDYDIANLVDEPSTAPNKRAFHGVRAANPRIFIEVHKRIREQRKVLLGSLNNLVEEVATLVKETAQRAAEFVVDLTHRKFGPSAYANLAISAVPKNLTTSPFSKTKTDVKIFNTTGTFKGGEAELSAYCVNCGIRGSIHLYGEVLFTLADGLTSANLNLDGNIAGRLVLGIDAHIKYTFEDRKQVFDAGVPGFTIPKIITVGPVITLDAKFKFEFSAQAQIQAGVEVAIPNFSARLDLVDYSRSGTKGFEPETTPIFTASGEIKASSTFSTPLSLAIGVLLPLIKFNKTVALTEEPGITAMASYSTTQPNCLTYGIKFVNDLYVDLFGIKKITLLGPTTVDIIKPTCYHLTKRESLAIDAATLGSEHGALRIRQDDSGGITEPYDDTNPDNTEFQDLDAEAREHAQAIQDGTAEDEDFGFSFVPIYDATSAFLLSNDDDGTLHITPVNSTTGGVVWQQYGNFITSDDSARLLHYHKNEMDRYGVSRVNLADLDTMPADARLVELVPASTFGETPAGDDYYTAIDTSENAFFLVTCVYKSGAPSRIFLVQDLLTGPITLADPELRFTITGDYVEECLFQGFLAG